MDTSEFKLIDIKYSEDDLKKIDEYNQKHLDKALELFKYNRQNILENEKESDNNIKDRVISVQTNENFRDFCRTYPIVSKYIIAFGLFSKKAFIKYLDWKAKVRPSDITRTKLTNNQREQAQKSPKQGRKKIWKNINSYLSFARSSITLAVITACLLKSGTLGFSSLIPCASSCNLISSVDTY
jgi:hypothetical protein